ncbi:MAG: putative RNA methyltransferase [Chlamydiia bacterium]|nr:putative RNA methyltransferase [Chlamydiia bacterium]
MDLQCNYFPACSGCSHQGTEAKEPPALAEVRQWLGEVEWHCGAVVEWRTRAKLAVRDGGVGLFERGSHRLVAIPDCPLHTAGVRRVIEAFVASNEGEGRFMPMGLAAYDEAGGCVRYIQVSEGAGMVQLGVVVRAANVERVARALERGMGEVVDSLWINVNLERGNAIFGEEWVHVSGKKFLEQEVLGRRFLVHPGAFVQAHQEMFGRMLERIREGVWRGKRLVEFYGGYGVIGVSVADLCESVGCVELNRFARESFDASMELNGDVAEKVSYFEGEAEQFIESIEASDVIVLDPPRKGICSGVLKALGTKKGPAQCIIISCGFESLKNDLNVLKNEKWVVTRAECFNFFPGSDHVETLVFLEKK